ncbi:ABC transporter substrate-binding protein [Sabulicella glaciei]|uniref:ABC transporter substrate-binding protein n=1 Tax=Sabulicella glaciei TaxID=2984948 RepID=A0ABT3P1T1_9PROT|nr:ABC transporter substrate-binding protein [Roseococcus sp. MDT2-1-1]MCW8088356.1 ABC transporter substrate-binding protein [Roseococcus sp. MDT2-1-1]
MFRQIRRRAAALVGAALLLAPLAALAQDSIPLPDRIRRAGKIVVATYPNYPPLTYRDPQTNARLGFDVELTEAIGRQLGVSVEWQEMPFVQFFPSLQTGRIDLAIDGISDLPARRGPLDFVNYLRTGAQFLTLDRNAAIREPTDLCGKRVGASRSTNWPRNIEAWSQENCVARGRPAITVVGTEGSVDARTQLRTERIDASVQGNETMGWLMRQEPGVYRTLGEPFTENLTGIPVASSEPQLRDAVKAALERLLANGTYRELLRKHGLEANALSAITVNAGR